MNMCNAREIFRPSTSVHAHPSIRFARSSLNWSRAAVNFSVTTSHRSIRSLKPFSRASRAVVVSGEKYTGQYHKLASRDGREWSLGMCKLTVGLDADVHFSVGGVGDRVTTELDSWAGEMSA